MEGERGAATMNLAVISSVISSALMVLSASTYVVAVLRGPMLGPLLVVLIALVVVDTVVFLFAVKQTGLSLDLASTDEEMAELKLQRLVVVTLYGFSLAVFLYVFFLAVVPLLFTAPLL